MRRYTLIALLLATLGGCANLQTVKAPCADSGGGPCTRTPLPNEPMELTA